MAKPVPIQPGPLHHNVMIAPNLHGGKKQDAVSSGLTIRTSRHWVLPPRPKPGRKPSCLVGNCRNGAVVASTCAKGGGGDAVGGVDDGKGHSVCVSQASVEPSGRTGDVGGSGTGSETSNGNGGGKKSAAKKPKTKIVLRKEIQQLKLENTKLKKELGRLVGSLQDLKRKCSSPTAVVGSDSKSRHSNRNEEWGKKRGFVEDTTEAFLKFEDDEDDGDNGDGDGEGEDDDDDEDDDGLVSVDDTVLVSSSSLSQQQQPALTTVRLAQALSYSSRTNLTDEEEVGSTPSSLFSSDLHGLSVVSTTTTSTTLPMGVGGGNTNPIQSPPLYDGNGSPSPSTSSSKPAQPRGQQQQSNARPFPVDSITFLDDYELSEFCNKHHDMLLGNYQSSLPEDHQRLTKSNTELDSIKEEDYHASKILDSTQQDMDSTSILRFLKTHINGQQSSCFEDDDDDELYVVRSTAAAADDDRNGWVMVDDDCVDVVVKSKSDYFMPPSLEELMEEQDDCDRDSKLLGPVSSGDLAGLSLGNH
ncbi:transcription factor HAP4 Ecym_7406 [Eremothecium cymbalariae DBVPG|uniref:Hap4 transcription factor heteromerisation domain-containing protein n=1 Tax=Eremothecium cymbalariae (strain CBS 270.75 / DBVPG 7215 / KCTC 17166 / NRRL Y-17582) TaxID=931890 RepID=G8JWL7_ERECY|nr:hypothetical protein Ecym_7406 [Eremothecium cymbalariae DBVPG\